MVRDAEITRLTNYLKGLGVKVTFSNADSEYVAECALDNSEIVIYKKQNTTKIETVLSLIHEAGHAVNHIWNEDRTVNQSLAAALDKSTKKARYKVLQDERKAATYWDIICKDTDIKIPKWRIEYQKEYDLWLYEYHYETGSLPTSRVKQEKRKQLKAKWKR